MGLEPTTSGTTIQRSNRLNYIHRISGHKCKNFLSYQKGFSDLYPDFFPGREPLIGLFGGFHKNAHFSRWM